MFLTNLLKNFTKFWINILIITCCTLLFTNNIYAQSNDLEVDWFNILPELTEEDISDINNKIKTIWNTWWRVWEAYNNAASGMSTAKQISSWIMNWDTIMNYLVFIVKFLSQLWLVVGTWFIMYAWYKYMLSVFEWWKTPSETIKNAIIWVIIVIFSYAIMRILTSIIWLT